MRIVLIASGFVDYSLELAAALSRAHDVTVFADEEALAQLRGASAARLLQGELRPFRQDTVARRWAGAAWRAADLAARRPDAVLAHEHARPHLIAGLKLARRLAPLGLIVHHPDAPCGPGDGGSGADGRGALALRASADVLFTHGEGAANGLRARCGRPVVAIRHGPILTPDQPAPPPGRRRVLMFGRMASHKGLDVLLEAHRRLRARNRPYQLHLVGEGPELDLRAAAFQALGGCRVSHRFVPRAELLEAIAASDLIAAPYTRPAPNGVAAAAMSNGRGIAACPVGELGDMAREGVNARLAPPGDPQALAEAIERGLDEAPALGRGALALAQGPFAWARAASIIAAHLGAASRSRG